MTDHHLVRVRRILDKLKQVRTRGLTCFGSDHHGFRLNKPLPEFELLTFEQTHGIRLPDDYRTFLTHAGNGGAGPYYGIFPLEKWNDFAEWVEDDRPDDFLPQPCPLHPEMRREPDWAEEFAGMSPYQGTLSLGTQGCTFATQLVVAGTYAGRVVYVDVDGQPPYMVREPDFLAWYERWLDELLLGYKPHSFGYGPGGGEDDFFRILSDTQASEEFRSEAARAFSRLPRLSDAAADRIPAFCSDTVAGVRAGACAAIRTFQLRQAEEAAGRLLGDPVPEVRREAVWTVMQLDPDRWAGAVLRNLHEDPDENVASSAFHKLKEAGALPRPVLLRIIEESPLSNLRYLAAYTMEWTYEDLGLLLRLLTDPNAQVRNCAARGLRQSGARGALPQILDHLRQEQDEQVTASTINLLGTLGDPAAVPALLQWAESRDDFHRLDAMQALAAIGDDRAVPIAKAMLQEDRVPVRRDADGMTRQSNIHPIRELVRKSLKASPNPVLRELAD